MNKIAVNSFPVANNSGRRGNLPNLVDAAMDLVAQSPGLEKTWFDSIFIAGQVVDPHGSFGILVHLLSQPASNTHRLAVVLTNTTTGAIKSHSVMLAANDFTWSRDKLAIIAPGLRWSGDVNRQSVVFSTDWGAIDIILEAKGPALYYGGLGSFKLLGEVQFQFALPDMHTTGTLTFEGRTMQISGESWLDRQWGGLPDLRFNRWSWMNLGMPNGDKVAIWDARSADGTGPEESWATILHANGNHELVPVTPLADSADRFHESAENHFAFPTKWTVSIPSCDASLEVITTSINQEIPGLGTSIYEGAATFSGKYLGQVVEGRTYVEQLGNWSR
jgi:Lipocalin-like domain/CrtC N-terminal lipocalin domain